MSDAPTMAKQKNEKAALPTLVGNILKNSSHNAPKHPIFSGANATGVYSMTRRPR